MCLRRSLNQGKERKEKRQEVRRINLIILHCSDSDIPAHDNIETIRQWHLERGFNDVGYHYFIDKSGNVHPGRNEADIGAHTKGHNSSSLGICLSGRHEFTPEQFKALEKLCLELVRKYGLEKTDILPHNAFDKGKTCPNFDVHALISTWDWH